MTTETNMPGLSRDEATEIAETVRDLMGNAEVEGEVEGGEPCSVRVSLWDRERALSAPRNPYNGSEIRLSSREDYKTLIERMAAGRYLSLKHAYGMLFDLGIFAKRLDTHGN